MSQDKQDYLVQRRSHFKKLQKNLKKKGNTITYEEYENFKASQNKKKQDDTISQKSTASEARCHYMNFQRTDINQPENINYFKRQGNPKVNYFNKNKDMNVFQNHIPSKSYNNFKPQTESTDVQSQSLNDKEINAISNFKIKKFTEFFQENNKDKNSNNSVNLKNQYNSYLDQHCIKSLIKNIKKLKQETNKSQMNLENVSKVDRTQERLQQQQQKYDQISNIYKKVRINEKKQPKVKIMIDNKSQSNLQIIENFQPDKPIDDIDEAVDVENQSQNENDNSNQEQIKEDNALNEQQSQQQDLESQFDNNFKLRRQLSDDISLKSFNSKISEKFDHKFIPNYICHNKLKPRYSINYTTMYMSQFNKEPHKKDVFNNQTLQKQVNHEMNQTFKKLNEQTISEIEVPAKVFPHKTTNQYFHDPKDNFDQMLHYKFTQHKPYMKGMQNNTTNRHMYLYPENIKEVMGPECPQFHEIMEQRVLHDIKFDHPAKYALDYQKIINNPFNSKHLPPPQQETKFNLIQKISKQKRLNVLLYDQQR